jgi:antitoxin ParD1/3/4
MDVAIGDRWVPLMNDLVEQGSYASASDVVTEALALLAQREADSQALRQSLIDVIEEGGEATDEEVDAALDAVVEKMIRLGYLWRDGWRFVWRSKSD